MQLYDIGIEWKCGQPPISEPECGFSGEKCISKFNNCDYPH